MKKIFSNKLLLTLLILFFLCVFSNTFLCYTVSYFSKNNSKNLYVIIPFIAILFAGSFVLLIILLKKYSSVLNIFLFSCLTIFIVAVIDTVCFKVISEIDSESFLNLTGFKSIILLFSYYCIILICSLLPLKKEKEKEILEEQKI
ncbi:MAG: hypothetical protein MJ222_02735 [Bacilli bacterium]|nr:hypothetical protein [Bacilli bacterium]